MLREGCWPVWFHLNPQRWSWPAPAVWGSSTLVMGTMGYSFMSATDLLALILTPGEGKASSCECFPSQGAVLVATSSILPEASTWLCLAVQRRAQRWAREAGGHHGLVPLLLTSWRRSGNAPCKAWKKPLWRKSFGPLTGSVWLGRAWRNQGLVSQVLFLAATSNKRQWRVGCSGLTPPYAGACVQGHICVILIINFLSC